MKAQLTAYQAFMRVLKKFALCKNDDYVCLSTLRNALDDRHFNGVVSCVVSMYKADRNFIRCSKLSDAWALKQSNRDEIAMPGLQLHGCHVSLDLKSAYEDRLSDAIYDVEYISVEHDVLIDIINKLVIKTVGAK